MMDGMLQRKTEKLKALLTSYGQVAVAFSGGVDSTLLLKVARDVLGKERVLAITAESDFVPVSDVREAQDFCQQEGVQHQLAVLEPLRHYDVRRNPADRCYFCKRLVFGRLREIAGAAGIVHLLDGSNVDDQGDYRPGAKAVKELGVLSPLLEAGFTKADVRALSAALGLKTAQKPSAACLASRIPYGEEITPAKLKRVEEAENFLHEVGFLQVRVRSHADLARIELPKTDIAAFMDGHYEQVVPKLRALGFAYVTLDLEGYRTGSLNEALKGK
ncbi:uncharacterized protein SAMN05216582_12027 [Selenomonas ruminantium]|uniref:NAD/GMP synthase domain-containing protein n=1 Tax=Selenomonas ruminantium TaxID=971 RepID=A0A1M6VRI8_SELRU|nr:ATP-dependent sacrificial sulfur transferase LarE [Selenomonas ruminantium]SHK83951.1 uncharacterized protein SAMN05216582_12027 [Selenomonas ruminantium]